MHRDSIGSLQLITPGAVNWMVAGKGVVHSERVSDAQRGKSRRLHGLQLWVALPVELEETDPSFQHVAAADIPEYRSMQGAVVRVLVGQAFGLHSPVNVASPTLYLDVHLPAHTEWDLPPLAEEMALYSPEHDLQVQAQAIRAQEMVVLPKQTTISLRTGESGGRFVVIGGAPLAQPVRMWWNFVSTDRQRIAAAAKRWESGGFDAIPGEAQRVLGPRWVD